MGALCRIFCNKKTNEEISPLYLARFYLALQKGLQMPKKSATETVGMIIVNSCNIFRSNLDGVNIVLPQFVQALEVILSEKDGRNHLQNVTDSEIRRSAIQILLSILPLPMHFKVRFEFSHQKIFVEMCIRLFEFFAEKKKRTRLKMLFSA